MAGEAGSMLGGQRVSNPISGPTGEVSSQHSSLELKRVGWAEVRVMFTGSETLVYFQNFIHMFLIHL